MHHNPLKDSYTIEGPRNHLRVSHNDIHVDNHTVFCADTGKRGGTIFSAYTAA